ncbi:MAG: VWA domain-containing protein [Planctomycetes bacterium]|nr:VWA domain-containing protein [Planctomycetota bacterium]
MLPGMVANGTNYSDGLRKAIDLLAQAPPGFAREIIVLCDGVDNVEREALLGQVHRARGMNARIDAVAIGHDKAGHSFDFSRLIAMTRPTGGRVMGVGSLKALQERFEGLAARGGRDLGRAVAKVLVMDVSPSMTEAWDRSTKLACAQLAAARWLAIEAKMQ